MKRRSFIAQSGALLAATSGVRIVLGEESEAISYRHPEVFDPAKLELPEDKRLPFGWKAFAVPAPGADENPVLRWEGLAIGEETRFRLTIAIDIREENEIEIRLADSGEKLGVFDIRFAPVLEPFELLLDREQTARVATEGITLVMTKGKLPVWFLAVEQDRPDSATLQPHLLFAKETEPLAEFHDRVASPVCLQPWGWMNGCVLDGLHDLGKATGDARYDAALQEHLGYFFDENQQLIYENPKSVPHDGIVSDIESTLPQADIARQNPDHPVLEKAVKFWKSRRDEAECVKDGSTTSAEGSYTIGYPMMVIGNQWQDEALIELALTQIRLRQERLILDGDCWLRHHGGDRRSFRNWARGVAWYSLGLVRTLVEYQAGPDVSDLRAEVERWANWVSGYQQESGLWNCFLHEDVLPDTSGSAGIAAALAIAVNHGLLPDEYRKTAQKTFAGLQGHLTPDGLLTGVAQSNRGGQALQESDYRVISQMGMGLMAQLSAALS